MNRQQSRITQYWKAECKKSTFSLGGLTLGAPRSGNKGGVPLSGVSRDTT